MGIDEWNVRGLSYGTAVAMELMRSHPEGLRSVLLDSVVTPDDPFGAVARGKAALHAFGELRDACAAQTACYLRYGDTDSLLARAAAQLDAHPYTATLEDDDDTSFTRHPVKLTGGDLYAAISRATNDPTRIRDLLGALTDVVDGDYWLVEQLASETLPRVVRQ